MASGIVRETFNLNLKILRILGMYPFLNHKSYYKIFAILIYCFLIVTPPSLIAIYLFVNENVTMEMISESAFHILQCGSSIVKLIPFIFNGDEVREVLYFLEDPAFNLHSKKQENKFIERFIKTAKQITYLYLGISCGSLLAWGAQPLLSENIKFPNNFYMPYDPFKNIWYYIGSYIYIVLGVSGGAIINGVLDPMAVGLLVFANCQVKILKDNLENLDKNVKLEVLTKNQLVHRNKIIYRRIQACIKHHNAILKLVEKFENTFSSVVFTQFAASVSVICLAIYKMSLISPDSFVFFHMTTFLMTILLEIFLYCYFGTNLYNESYSLINAVYMGNWYEYDIRSQKALIILMERAKRPMKVTAGKILELSLETFTTILRRAYSLLAVLQTYE